MGELSANGLALIGVLAAYLGRQSSAAEGHLTSPHSAGPDPAETLKQACLELW